MILFQSGHFTLHSGAHTFWKVDCDALTDGDLDTLAMPRGVVIFARGPCPEWVTPIWRLGL